MPVSEIEVGHAADDKLTVTLRGEPEALIRALVSGLDRDSLVAIKDALEAEIAKRAAESSS